MQIVTGRRGEPHVTSRQMQAVYRSFLGDFALLDIGEKLRAEAYSNDIVRVYDGVVSVQGIYAVIAYNQYDEVYIEPVSVGKKRIDTIVLHYTKDNALDVEDMQLDVVQGEEYTDNPIAPVVPEGGDAWEGTTDIQVPIYDVEVTNFGLTVIPHARMLTVIPTLDSIAERIPETVVTGVKGDSEVLYRDGDVNITKANIGLGNVDNTADTDKPISTATQTALNLKADLTYVDAKISAAYHAGGNKTVAELTSALLIADNIGKVYNMSDSGVTTSDFVEGAGEPINEGDNVGICNVGTEESPVYKFDLLSGFVDLSAYATTSAVNAGLEGKVDKVTGKGLSTEDYTTTDKTKLAGIEAEANKTVVDSAMSDSSTNPLQNKVITAELNARTAKIYSFHINDAESDPSNKVTYLDDAVGMTPAHMNFSTDKFDYGSWGNVWFVKECKPCIFAQAGYVMKYLDPDDYTKDIDGNTVAIDGGLTGANVMIEFPKIWYKVTPDGNDENSGTVSISSVKIDKGYKDYAYIDYQGNHKEHFYMPAYNGSLINGVMRSLSNQQASKIKTGQEEIDYCKANGDGWYTEDAGEIMLINFLLILMGKSTDTQTVYGQGLHTGGTEAINDGFRTGVHNDKGMFYGTNSGTIASGSYGNAVKVFGIENYWGFQWRRYAGDMLVNGVRKIKLCYGTEDGSTVSSFNSTGSGYVDVGATPSGTSGGYISQIKFTTNGMFSKVSSGSSATYFCDGQWYINSDTRYAFHGGCSVDGAHVGAFCVSLDSAASVAGWYAGAAPSYK